MKKYLSGLVLVISLMVIFLTLELLSRATFMKMPTMRAIEIKSPYQFSKNQNIGYEMKHNDPPNTTHDFDYRNRIFSVDRPDNSFRIIAIGDSVTVGVALVKDYYPSVLEEILNNFSAFKKFEVLNFGVGGYGIFQKKILLEEEILKYNPDLIILQLEVMDVFENRKLDLQTMLPISDDIEVEYFDKGPIPLSVPLPPKINKFLLNHSYFWRYVSLNYYYVSKGIMSIAVPESLDDYETTNSSLREIVEITKNNNTNLIIVLFPNWEPKCYYGCESRIFLRKVINDLGANFLDLYETFGD